MTQHGRVLHCQLLDPMQCLHACWFSISSSSLLCQLCLVHVFSKSDVQNPEVVLLFSKNIHIVVFPPNPGCTILPNKEGFQRCRLLQQCSVYMYAVSCSLTQLPPSVLMLSHFNIVFFCKPGASPLLHLSFCHTPPPPYFLGSAGCLPLAVYHSSWYLRPGWVDCQVTLFTCSACSSRCTVCVMDNELN